MMEALYGLLGVIVGSSIPWVKDEWHRRRARKENGQFLAVQVIAILDEYAEKCVEVVQDDGTVMGQASRRDEQGHDFYEPVVDHPSAPEFPENLDWKSIDGDLMYRILMLPSTVRETDNYIRFIASEIASMPDYPELYEARWEGYAKLGLKAMAITEDLRGEFELPDKGQHEWNADWNPKNYLEEKLENIEQTKIKNAERHEEMLKSIREGEDNDSK